MAKRPIHNAAELIPNRPTLSKVRDAARQCRACHLWKLGTQTVFGEGGAHARLMFVGEQPGNEEDLAGHPFVGPAGKLLDRALADAGIDRAVVYVTNVVKHFKWEPRGKRRIHKKPNAAEIAACRPWLDTEIELVKPCAIVCLGATAAQALISPSFRITQDRGQLIPWTPPGLAEVADDGHQEADDDEPDEGAPAQRWMLATTHPSAVLRAPEDGRDVAYDALVNDLKVVAHALA